MHLWDSAYSDLPIPMEQVLMLLCSMVQGNRWVV